MSNELHPVFAGILGSVERNNVATSKAVQQAASDAEDAASWRWLQANIEKAGGAAISAKKNGVQSFVWGVPNEIDDEVDEPMTAEDWRDIHREMRDDDDRAGIV